ncbi:retrovirus-related Pol polyprotein from transposon 297 [Trichonephila clavipes]|nr:retrovirus-related Pol polyprotein from transposon 297 [Trichonephila clavipes]
MGQCVQLRTRNYGALDQTARVCFGVLCANRTREVKRDFVDLRIRRSEGRVVNTPLLFKKGCFGGHEEKRLEKKPGEREKKDVLLEVAKELRVEIDITFTQDRICQSEDYNEESVKSLLEGIWRKNRRLGNLKERQETRAYELERLRLSNATETVSVSSADLEGQGDSPREIQSDLGTSFTSELTTTFFNKFGIKVTRTVAESTGFSPIELVMGKNLRTPQTFYEEWMEEGNTSQSVVEYILQLNNRLKRCQDIAITWMKECQLKRKTWYDRDVVEGDLVMVLVTSKQNKLEVNWIGPGKSKPGKTHEEMRKYPGKQCTKFDYHEIRKVLLSKLSPSHSRRIKNKSLLKIRVFPDPGTTHLMRMDIELISDKPIKTKPYRMSPRQINILREEIKRLWNWVG